MKNKYLYIKLISVLMAFWITFVTLPMQAISLDTNETLQNEENLSEFVSEINNDVFIVEEDISKRGQFEKHYLCSDGSYISVTYPEAIHYLDNQQHWQDIDKSLTYDSVSGKYISDTSGFEVSFSNKASPDNIVQIQKNNHVISWGIQTTQKSETSISKSDKVSITSNNGKELISIPLSSATAKVDNIQGVDFNTNSERILTDKNAFTLPKISSQISYSNVFGNTQNITLRYTVYQNKIEEDIIIYEKGDITSISMNMDVGVLTPIVNDNGSVDLVDCNNNMQFHIGIPYMVDASYNVCTDIQVAAVKTGTSCIITYTPSAEWFESNTRVFPILLDPSISTNDYVSNIQDTYVEQDSTENHTSDQLLYFTKNTNNKKRNIVVRVTELPVIDNSMPIISAKLTLTAESSPNSDISLRASYIDSALELNEYDYGVTNSDIFAYTAYGDLCAGFTQVVFDFTSHIYQMYNDQKYDQESGYNYHGDFIIGYADINDTSAASPFYSSEHGYNKPVFTVKYGYTLPAGMLDGGIYSFKNVGSYSYMSVNETSPSNVYQKYNINGIPTESQKFKLVYMPSSGGYIMRSMNPSVSTNRVVNVDRGNGELADGLNVRLSTTTDSVAREWLIIPIDYNIFRIVPRGNMSLSLTTYGMDDGSNSGTTLISPGNIYIQPIIESYSNQEWYIYDDNNNELNTGQFRAVVETGNYFIGNDYTGRYLHRSGEIVNGMKGELSYLGENTVKWHVVNLGDGYCTIQRSDMPHYYLAPTGTTSGSSVKVYSNYSETIPNNYKWSIRIASGGGCLIQHKSSGLYLSGVSQTTNPSTVCLYALNSPGTTGYSKQVWRIAEEDHYVELGIAASFNDVALDIGATKIPAFNKTPSTASWASYADFEYNITSGADYVSYNSSTNRFIGLESGSATITATHKTTGRVFTFNVNVAGYASADLAAKAFATRIYASSLYIRHEYATMIYKVTSGSATLYFYTPPVSGTPHSVVLPIGAVPSNGTTVAYSHTHPNRDEFSQQDIIVANNLKIDAYFNGPNLEVQKFNYNTGQYPIGVGPITPTPLTNDEKQALQSEFYSSWHNHITNEACELGCDSITWPTP